MKINISIGNSRMDKHWNHTSMEMDEFVRRISTTRRTAETVEQYKTFSKAQQDKIKDVGGFVLGTLKDGRRKKDSVLSRSGLTLDMDYARPETIDQIEMLTSFHSWIYSTHKHTPEKPRLRVIIPLSREVTPEEYTAVARKIAEEIGIELFDDTTYEPSRLMYWASTSSDGEFIFREIKGELLNPDDVLAKYKNWRNVAELPVSNRQQTIVQRDIGRQADPHKKAGAIGVFCRTYTVTEALDTFLSDVYKHSEMAGRFDYIPADSQGGVVVYDDKFAYSHHASDPVCGNLMNAFDVVRLHRFGHLDARCNEDTETTRLPSYKAMQEFAVQDERVKDTLAKERMAQATMDFKEDDQWQQALGIDKHGQIKDTLTNIYTILRCDPNLKSIVYNQFKSMLDVVGDLPWKQVKPGWSDADLASAKVYFERTYGLWSPIKFKDALLAVTTSERLYHPVKAYLSSLEWDGIPRVETLLVDYLGAEDTPYVRAVTRKTLVAAIARIYKPGIKFDSILVLNGDQGEGKSTIFSILGREWFSDSLSIADMRDKTAAEKLQGYWILEIPELNGIRKMDVETVKSFITRTDDKYRHAYGVNVENHPRSCIMVGTTNTGQTGFLRDLTGNRRFWPVRTAGKGTYYPWELKDQDQVWAEAIEYFNRGEELYLKADLAAAAYVAQREAMEADDREGLVQEYLDTLLPDCWHAMDLYQRRSYLGENEFEGGEQKGIRRREKVCTMEIWCECFGKERQNLRRTDSGEIEGILNRMGGWQKLTTNQTGKTRFPLYGPQRTFVRQERE